MRATTTDATPDTSEGPNTIRQTFGRALVISPKGPSLSESDAAGVLAESMPDAVRARGRVVLDMARVEYMSSAGISMLVQIRETCMGEGGTLVLCNLAKPIASVLKGTRVDRLFVITSSREKALAKIDR